MNGTTAQPVARQLAYVGIGAALILAVPLVAMLFTSEVDWGLFDFIVMGALLCGTGSVYVLAARMIPIFQYRLVLGIALAIMLLLAWAELAVGLFGTPFAGS